MYEYQDFSKNDKKLLREFVDIGVNREIENFFKTKLPHIQSVMKKEYEDYRVPYWKLTEEFDDFSKYLRQKYDGYSHRNLPLMLASLLFEGHFTDKDIADFSDSGKAKLKQNVEWLKGS